MDNSTGLLGVVGGMSWRATAEYHRLANELTEQRLGPRHSADLLLRTLDFDALLTHFEQGRPELAGAAIAAAARQLAAAGAEPILLAANTAHRWFDEVTAAVPGRVLHIADPVAARAQQLGVHVIGLLGTRMATQVYARTGFDLVLPSPHTQEELDELILNGLATRQARSSDIPLLDAVIDDLTAAGADAVVLACTDFAALTERLDAGVPLLDSATLHVAAALTMVGGTQS
jgi:aspartate racemase